MASHLRSRADRSSLREVRFDGSPQRELNESQQPPRLTPQLGSLNSTAVPLACAFWAAPVASPRRQGSCLCSVNDVKIIAGVLSDRVNGL